MATATQTPTPIPAPPAPPAPVSAKKKPGRKPGQASAAPAAPATHGNLNLRLPLGIIEEIRKNLGGSKYVEELVVSDFFARDLLIVRPE